MRKNIIVLVCVIVTSLTGSAWSAVVYNQWSGTTSDWNTAGNWALGYVPNILAPNGIDNVKAGFKTATGPVLGIGTTDAAAYQITLGGSSGGILTMTGGALNVSQYLAMGVSATENGRLDMNSGSITIGQKLFVGQGGTGTVNMIGGNINITAELTIADLTTATGTVNLNGGVITASLLQMKRSGGGTAKLDIGGGTLILNGDQRTAITNFGSLITAYNGLGTLNVDYNNVNIGKTTLTATQVVPQASSPGPSNGAANVALNATLSWTAGDGAVSHNVYFGTASPGAFQGNQPLTPATFNPGTLTPSTVYFWRIDEVNESDGVTTGNVWNFTTTTGQALSPSPANSATSVSLTPTLSWTAGPGAESHNVYFGTASPGDSQGNQPLTPATFNPGSLDPNTTYYWRIDEVSGSNTITGNVWSFTTKPLKATVPNPSSGAAGVALNATLSWTAGGAAVSHDVYFGTVSPGTSSGNQEGTTYNPGTLAANTTYYWRIDEKDSSNNTTTGDVWSFTTTNPTVAYPYLSWRNDPTNSIVVNWWNPIVTGDSSVDYGLTNAYGSTVNVATVTNYHHVELTGLTPSTTYHYKISSTDGTVGSDNTFTTADVNTTSFSFAMYGDPRGTSSNEPYYTRHQALCDWILAQDYKFALETGDTVWEGGGASAQGFYTDFFRLESNLSKSKVIMATMGNHEVQPSGNTYIYTDLYGGAFPTNGTSGNNGRVYSFNYGNAHFVCLSSYQVESLTLQKNWLIADLTAARANPNIKWIFVMMHAPLYTTNGHTVAQTTIDAWAPVFEQYGVDIVFAGHNHCYERSYPIRSGQVAADGYAPIYLTNGMGGAEFNSTQPSPLFAARYGTEVDGGRTVVTSITINGLLLTVDTIKNATGVVIDSFTLTKTPPPIKGDFNGDYTVDANDLEIFSGSWLNTGIWP